MAEVDFSPAAVADRLAAYNLWRRGDDVEMPAPADLGRDIDAAVAALRAIGEYAAAVARIAELEKALRPFADLGSVMLPADPTDRSVWVTCPDDTEVNNITGYGFNFGHFREAARVLPEEDGPEHEDADRR